jgi:hypothetical protein
MSTSIEDARRHVESLTTIAHTKAFLGREFLTWLWYLAESQGKITLRSQHFDQEFSIDLWTDDKLVLESPAGTAHESVFKGGDPGKSMEAAISLKSGKTAKELKLGMNIDGVGDFIATLNCQDLNPRGLLLPPEDEQASKEADGESRLLERLYHTDVFLEIVDLLFARFLKNRSMANWGQKGLKDLREWIEKKSDRQILH